MRRRRTHRHTEGQTVRQGVGRLRRRLRSSRQGGQDTTGRDRWTNRQGREAEQRLKVELAIINFSLCCGSRKGEEDGKSCNFPQNAETKTFVK